MDVSEEELNFGEELNWCMKNLELHLCSKIMSKREAQQRLKCLKILRNKSSPYIQKRQAMRQAFGDYRKIMAEESKMYRAGAVNFKWVEVKNCHLNGKLIRMHKPNPTESECSFRFNFPDPLDDQSCNA